MKPASVAILDVGKTNKKVSLYDRRFQVMGEERTTLEPYDFNGVEVENTAALLAWFRTALKKLAKDADVRAIAITTHGATIAVLDESGNLAHPVISYTAARGADIQEEFYKTYGDRMTLHRETSTPDLGFANMGKSLFYLKTRLPEVWAKCRHALFYPAYLGYELTGQRGMESTYLGNHSYLWNYADKTWSRVGLDLQADKLFPDKFQNSWDCLGAVKPEIAAECGLPTVGQGVATPCLVTMGIHDSNANFLPYLTQGYDNFLLNSTGTWCVLMRPVKWGQSPIIADVATEPGKETPIIGDCPHLTLTPGEMEAKVLFNLDALGRPVRTLIFPAGMEYDTFRGFTELKDQSDAEVVRQVLRDKKLFVIPGVLPDASAFPGATARVVNGEETTEVARLFQSRGAKPFTSLGQAYYGALNLSLALATRKMLDWCHITKGTTVFIEGGFAKNKTYCELLATLCPDQTFALTNVKEGTSFGAALTGWMLAEGLSLEQIGKEFEIKTTGVPRIELAHVVEYEERFLTLTRE